MPKTNEPKQTLLKNPYRKEIDTVMSNFDHQIDSGVADRLKKEPVCSRYPGWNFNGMVWYGKIKKTYHCEVWQYHEHLETVSGTLQKIMDEVSDRYGDD